jgi:hypothetical protein
MAGRLPQTEKWTARENKQDKRLVMIVNGHVRVNNTNERPCLAEPATGDRPSKTLILDLAIETDPGRGTDARVWKAASYHKDVKADQYAGVDIHWHGKSIAGCKILDDGEHFRHLVALTQAANKAHAPAAVTSVRGSAKKKSAKKKSAKKTSAKKKSPKKKSAKRTSGKKSPAKKRPSIRKRSSGSARGRSSAAAKKRPASRRRR